eukprot:11561811-Ditylum_brightwellii.AAC.1
MEIRSIQTHNNCIMPDYNVQAQIEETYKSFGNIIPNKQCKRAPRQSGKDKGGKKGENRTKTTREKGTTMGSKAKY